MDVELAVAIVGACGTILSAYILSKVHEVKREVNGHTQRLEGKIEALQARVEALLEAKPPTGA